MKTGVLYKSLRTQKPMVTIYYRNVKENTLRTLEEFKVGSWISVQSPTQADIEYLVTNFSIDEGLLRDALDFYEVPRVEVEGNVTYIFARYPYSEDDRILTAPVLIAIGEDFFLTLSSQVFPIEDKFLRGEIEFFTTQKTKFFLQFFFQINAAYASLLNNINRRVRGMTVQLEQIDNKDIIQFVTYENILNDFISALMPTSTMLQNLLSGKFLRLYKNDQDLIEDLFLNNGQLVEMSNLNLKTIVNIRESYSTIMSNNLNRVIRLLTVLTILFTIPTMIASLFGMNVRLPFADSPHVFSWILISIAIISSVLTVIFSKMRWL